MDDLLGSSKPEGTDGGQDGGDGGVTIAKAHEIQQIAHPGPDPEQGRTAITSLLDRLQEKLGKRPYVNLIRYDVYGALNDQPVPAGTYIRTPIGDHLVLENLIAHVVIENPSSVPVFAYLGARGSLAPATPGTVRESPFVAVAPGSFKAFPMPDAGSSAITLMADADGTSRGLDGTMIRVWVSDQPIPYQAGLVGA